MAKRLPEEIISHWSMHIEGLKESPSVFFEQLEETVKQKELKHVRLNRVDWKEGGILSATREYLQVIRKEHSFDVCGAPYGKGFFVSWWLGGKKHWLVSFFERLPLIGRIAHWFVPPMTYYKVDTALMFQSEIHAAVMEVIDTLTKAGGVRMLTPDERKPVYRDLMS